MEIRFAEGKDVAGILELLRQVGNVHHQGRPDLFRNTAQKYGASQVLQMLGSSTNPIFVAAEGNKVLGYAFCQVKKRQDDPVFYDRTELYVDDLCVDEESRQSGVGNALFEAVKKYAKMRACQAVTLNVWCFNEAAMAFYLKQGLENRNITMELVLE